MSNVDKALPQVCVDLGGEKRRLLFTLYSFALLEDLGIFSELRRKGEKGISRMPLKKLLALTWVALLEDCPELDGYDAETRQAGMRTVGRWMTEAGDLPAVSAKVGQAFANAIQRMTPQRGGPEKNGDG